MPFFRIPCSISLPPRNPLACLPQIASTLDLSPFVVGRRSPFELLFCPFPLPLSPPSMHKSNCPSHHLRHFVDSLFKLSSHLPVSKVFLVVTATLSFHSHISVTSGVASQGDVKATIRLFGAAHPYFVSIYSFTNILSLRSFCSPVIFPLRCSSSTVVCSRSCTHTHIYRLIVNCESRMPKPCNAHMLWNNT